ncbi:MAG: hypothetical protein QXQ68_08560 [Candidatus Nitrosocaldaceae archaeon]
MVYILNFTNSRKGDKVSLQVVEVSHGIYVNFVYLTPVLFQSISLYCSKDESRQIINFKNGRHVIIIDSMLQPTLTNKLQIKEWIMSIVNVLADKSLNALERDHKLTEMYYALLANLHEYAHY